MRIKSIISVLILSVCFFKSGAQQIFEISEYLQNNFLYNPAASGANDNPSVGATYRKMWSGIAGGPQTFIAFGDKYFDKERTGVGIAIYSDKTGPTSQTGGQINLSYSIPMENGKRLMFGLGGQVLQYQLNIADVQGSVSGLPLGNSSEIKGDAAAGIYYKSKTLNVGVSVEQLIQDKLNFITADDPLQAELYRHYYFLADYNWRTDEDNVLIPNILIKYLPNAPTDYQAGIRLEHKDLLWVGVSYNYQQSYSLYAGVKIDHRYSIGYAYEEFNAPISSFENGGASNELYLRYYFIK